MRNCISYEMTKKLAQRRIKKERQDAFIGFFVPFTVMLFGLLCLGIVLLA